jgi:hypothetical protein
MTEGYKLMLEAFKIIIILKKPVLGKSSIFREILKQNLIKFKKNIVWVKPNTFLDCRTR